MHILMFIAGIVVLVKGRLSLSKNKVVIGLPAYAVGVVMLLPTPLALAIGVLVRLYANPQADLRTIGDAIYVCTLLGCFLVAMVVGVAFAIHPKEILRREQEELRGDFDDFALEKTRIAPHAPSDDRYTQG